MKQTLQEARELASKSGFPEEDPALGGSPHQLPVYGNCSQGCRAEATEGGLQSRGDTGRAACRLSLALGHGTKNGFDRSMVIPKFHRTKGKHSLGSLIALHGWYAGPALLQPLALAADPPSSHYQCRRPRTYVSLASNATFKLLFSSGLFLRWCQGTECVPR